MTSCQSYLPYYPDILALLLFFFRPRSERCETATSQHDCWRILLAWIGRRASFQANRLGFSWNRRRMPENSFDDAKRFAQQGNVPSCRRWLLRTLQEQRLVFFICNCTRENFYRIPFILSYCGGSSHTFRIFKGNLLPINTCVILMEPALNSRNSYVLQFISLFLWILL